MGRFVSGGAALALALGACDGGDVYQPHDERDACTTILVGREATTFGGTLVTHTADCYNCDWRLAKVTKEGQRSRQEGHLEHTVRYFRSTYPGEVSERSPTWSAANLEFSGLGVDVAAYPFVEAGLAQEREAAWASEAWIEGTIAGVIDMTDFVGSEEEYASVEALYGVANEAGVSIGESTCEAYFVGKAPRTCPGCDGPLVDVVALSKVALRYCATAACAVELMGAVAVKHGYYGADLTPLEAGEALFVADGTEAWVFHILPDDTGLSAVWVANRIGADEVTVSANAFIIRGVPDDCDSEDRLDDGWRCSANLRTVADRAGILAETAAGARGVPAGALDFTATYGPRRDAECHFYAPYWTHRVWRILSLAAPAATRTHYAAFAGRRDCLGSELPYAARAEHAISAAEAMTWNRDHFEGTPFDMTTGPASGPWGDPSRFDMTYRGSSVAAVEATDVLPSIKDIQAGRFERGISIHRTSYSTVVTTKPHGTPVVWYGAGPPHAALYVPVLADGDVPDALARGAMFELSLDSMWWATILIANWMRGNTWRFSHADVATAQLDLEGKFQADVDAHDNDDDDASSEDDDATALNDRLAAHALRAWVALFNKLVSKYRDNMRQAPAVTDVLFLKYFYPQRDLDRLSWFDSTDDFYPEEGTTTGLYKVSPTEKAALPRPFTAALVGFLLGAATVAIFTRFWKKRPDFQLAAPSSKYVSVPDA